MPRRYALAGFVLLLAACGTPARVASDDALGEAVVVTGPQQALRGAQADAAADRQLVRTASLDVTVDGDDQVTPTVDRAAALAEELGGYVAQRGPSSVLLRVPDDRLDQALDALAALGDAGDREVFTRDVTAAYTDLQIRLDNARALQARLRTLLERADSVPDVLAVERELARVTVEVESLEGQAPAAPEPGRVLHGASGGPGRRPPRPAGLRVRRAVRGVKWLFVRD